ncbi:MAG: hypothetical protein OEV40_13465 [Acidimicrobiia bacterium]|nr:hypothetical protein [Acidimicrobiia bacterium]
MRKWVYPLLIAFVAFFIFSSPLRAGAQGRAFVDWLGDLAGAAGEFLEGVFNDEAPVPTNDNLQPNRSSAGGREAPSGSGPRTEGGGGEPSPDYEPGGDRFETLAPLSG